MQMGFASARLHTLSHPTSSWELSMRTVLACAALLLLAGCASTPAPSTLPLTQCPATRPQVCTMEYAPVCAQRNNGDMREYASGCNACADESVQGYLPGPCTQ